MSMDPAFLAAAARMTSPQSDQHRQHEVAMKQADTCLQAAKYILDNGPIFPVEVQQHARDYIIRVMRGLDNIRLVEQQPAEAAK